MNYKSLRANSIVLGSEGLIGSALMRALRDQEDYAHSVDIKNGLVLDLRNPSAEIENAIYMSNFVYFLAFDVGGSKYLSSNQSNFEYIQNNVKIMENTFALLEKYHKPFIFASSQMAGMQESPYGNLKLLGEKYTDSLGGMVVRMWNIYGNQCEVAPEKRNVVTDFILQALKNKRIDVLTTGDEERQFLHARDCADAYIAMHDHYEQGKHYDLSSFKWTAIWELAEMIATQCHVEHISYSHKEDSLQRSKLPEPNKDILSIWQPKISLEEGIKELIGEVKTYANL